jgi:hypothetical protein
VIETDPASIALGVLFFLLLTFGALGLYIFIQTDLADLLF